MNTDTKTYNTKKAYSIAMAAMERFDTHGRRDDELLMDHADRWDELMDWNSTDSLKKLLHILRPMEDNGPDFSGETFEEFSKRLALAERMIRSTLADDDDFLNAWADYEELIASPLENKMIRIFLQDNIKFFDEFFARNPGIISPDHMTYSFEFFKEKIEEMRSGDFKCWTDWNTFLIDLRWGDNPIDEKMQNDLMDLINQHSIIYRTICE